MDRRRFLLTSLGALAVPVAVGAQQAAKVRVIGLVFSTSPVSEMVGAEPVHILVRAFVRGLHDLGWVQGRNLTIEARSAEGHLERFPAIFRELVARRVEVMVMSGGGAPQWEVHAATQGNATFQKGPATAVAVGCTTTRADTTDANQWLVEITLVGE